MLDALGGGPPEPGVRAQAAGALSSYLVVRTSPLHNDESLSNDCPSSSSSPEVLKLRWSNILRQCALDAQVLEMTWHIRIWSLNHDQ